MNKDILIDHIKNLRIDRFHPMYLALEDRINLLAPFEYEGNLITLLYMVGFGMKKADTPEQRQIDDENARSIVYFLVRWRDHDINFRDRLRRTPVLFWLEHGNNVPLEAATFTNSTFRFNSIDYVDRNIFFYLAKYTSELYHTIIREKNKLIEFRERNFPGVYNRVIDNININKRDHYGNTPILFIFKKIDRDNAKRIILLMEALEGYGSNRPDSEKADLTIKDNQGIGLKEFYDEQTKFGLRLNNEFNTRLDRLIGRIPDKRPQIVIRLEKLKFEKKLGRIKIAIDDFIISKVRQNKEILNEEFIYLLDNYIEFIIKHREILNDHLSEYQLELLKDTLGEETEAKACAICFEDIPHDNKFIARCKHEFHKSCIEALKGQSTDTKCPTCRKEYALAFGRTVAWSGRRYNYSTL